MTRINRKWISLILTIMMLIALLPPFTANAAASRITITNLYIAKTIINGQPSASEDSNIFRYTTSPITITATIDGIDKSQISNLSYEITNVNTGKLTVDPNNKAQMDSAYDISFKNVVLTEGLNKVVIKLNGTSTVASEAGWAYFTPTTNIQDLMVNQTPFEDNKMYPENPAQQSTVTITGKAPNATDNGVQAQLLGEPAPKTLFTSDGIFLLTGDDKYKSTNPDFKLAPGDNLFTFTASNISKTYQLEKNLIYDNGKPFAFNALIKDTSGAPAERLIKTPTVTTPKVNISALIKDDLNTLNNVQYKYVDVYVGGTKFGPYDLSQYAPAPKVNDYFPKRLYDGYSDTELSLYGEALNEPGITVSITASDGSNPLAPSADLGPATHSGTNFATFTIPAGKLTAGSLTYTFFVERSDGTILKQFSMPAVTPTAPGTVNVATSQITGLKADYDQSPLTRRESINFNVLPPSFDPTKLTISFTDISGQPRGLGSNFSLTGSQLDYDLPIGLGAGDFKFTVTYNGVDLTEQYFKIDPAPLAAPTLASVATPVIVPDYTNVAGGSLAPAYLVVKGSNLGTDLSAITNAKLVDGAAVNPDIALTPYAVENSYAVFKIADQSALADNAAYHFQATVGATPLTVTNAYQSELLSTGAPTSNGTVYSGQIITSDLKINGALQNQLTLTEARDAATTIKVDGKNLSQSKLSAKVVMEDGTPLTISQPAITVTGGTVADIKLPTGLTVGNYILQFFDNDGVNPPYQLTQLPFSIIDPVLNNISPDTVPVTSLPATITGLGTNLGRNASLLQFKFVSDATKLLAGQVTASSVSGNIVKFSAPAGLAKGAYTVTMLYNNAPVATPVTFTVASEPASLKENLTWSKPGRYKVFDFSVDVPISADKYQLVEFNFYNTAADNVPKTSFAFNYMNPNLPYIDQVNRQVGDTDTTGILISEKAITEINELPATFFIYTDSKTKKVNAYLGAYDNNATPYKTLAGAGMGPDNYTTLPDGRHKFTLTLDGIPNGTNKLTVVPSADSSTAVPKSGENPAGSKAYDMVFTSTPYVIINNLYNGMVIKSETELSCTGVTVPCISGRSVNVPLTNIQDPALATSKVEFYLNGKLMQDTSTTTPKLIIGTKGVFNIQLNSLLQEGKNKFTFVISTKQNGVFTKVTESNYEIFKFSTQAPEFLSITPIEPADIKKYIPGGDPDTYSTSEDTVSLSGQFANASEIKLTVKLLDDKGNPVTPDPYDRRFNNFSTMDPITSNPLFFSSINTVTGQFATRSISLSPKGKTIFQFEITNASNITVTRSITIVREAKPYSIIYPTVFRNDKNEDQANINSNYIEIEMEAEFADQVLFGKQQAAKRKVNVNGIDKTHYFYEVNNLKAGKNPIKFTVISGQQKQNGTLILYNANTEVEGAQYKTPLKSKLKVFNGLVELSFPKGTNFKRNGSDSINPYLTDDRKLLFGIADPDDGRIDKFKHPASYDGQTGNPNPPIIPDAKLLFTEPTGRFKPVSKLIWIDAGTINKAEPDLNKALSGSGRLPYDSTEFYNRTLNDLVVPTQRGQLKLKYDAILRDEAWRFLTVYHYDIYEDNSGVVKARWRNIGGVVDPKSKTITVPLDRFGYYQVMFMDQSFDDMTAHPTARNDLETLYSKGYMLPKSPPSLFEPNDPITRGEFTTMLVKVFDMPLKYTENPTFTDVLRVNPLNNGLYDYKYIETAAKSGFVRGNTGGRFLPDSAIKRQDAAVMIAKAANMKMRSDSAKILTALQKQFTDANGIEYYTLPAVEAVTKAGLMKGIKNILVPGKKATYRFDPTGTITRAEAAGIMMNVLRQQKKVPK